MSETPDDFIRNNPQLMASNSKWAPKLTYAERCGALAALNAGFTKKHVALAFGINVSTLEFIRSPSSRHYKNVRRELADLGKERFHEKHFTDHVVSKLREFMHDPRLALNQKELDKEVAEGRTDAVGADKRANHKEGKYTTFSNIDGTMHLEVAWTDHPGEDLASGTPLPPGWYARLLSTSPDWNEALKAPDSEHGYWLGGDGSWMTSKKALDAALVELMAEIV